MALYLQNALKMIKMTLENQLDLHCLLLGQKECNESFKATSLDPDLTARRSKACKGLRSHLASVKFAVKKTMFIFGNHNFKSLFKK